ncbi:hypothetical protein [Nocardia terpenica]|uniref:hypothetical protein n=1 Tax=Nocardia terpenica TaxID=455432 RepID=UPI0012FE02E0|nr:hypothetical protein [Nocardia terpenica]
MSGVLLPGAIDGGVSAPALVPLPPPDWGCPGIGAVGSGGGVDGGPGEALGSGGVSTHGHPGCICCHWSHGI